MEKVRGGGDDKTGRQKGTSNGKKADPEQGDGDCDSETRFFSRQEDENDYKLRMEIRSKYRDLINSVEQNREDILSPSNNKLTEVIEEADEIFNDVRHTREVALDAQLLVAASDLGKEKANQLFSEGNSFDPAAFTEHLLSVMGLNRLVDGDDEQEGGDGYLPSDAWQRLARRTESCFKTAPSFHYILGSFHTEPPPPQQKIERRRKAPAEKVKRAMPKQLKKMEESHEEATEKEVERILGYLRANYENNSFTPLRYFNFVIDPTSFARTVENIFHTSFLIRDGLARMDLDEKELPTISPVEEGELDPSDSSNRNQCIITLDQQIWKELIDVFDIKECIIQPAEYE